MPFIDCLAVWKKCLNENEHANLHCFSKFNQDWQAKYASNNFQGSECSVTCGEMNKDKGPAHTYCGGSCGGNCPKHSGTLTSIYDSDNYFYTPGKEVDTNCWPFCKN